MGIIAASWDLSKADQARELFEKACRELTRATGLDLSHVVYEKQFAIAQAEPHSSLCSGMSTHQHRTVASCGWWYSLDSSSKDLQDFAKVESEDMEALNCLDGQYAVAIGNARSNEVLCNCDPMGSFPIYMAQQDGISWCGTSSIAIAKAMGAKLNPNSLRMLFLNGSMLAPSSAFEGISRLHAGELVSLKNGEANCRRVWSPFRPSMQHRNIHDAAAHGLDLLSKSWNRISENWSNISCDLTSGLDSRLVAAVAASSHKEFGVTVYGDCGETDVDIAGKIASHFRWDFDRVYADNDWGQQRLPYFQRAVDLSDGELIGTALDKTLYAKEMSLAKYAAGMSGVGGEFYRDFFWQQEFLNIGKSTDLDIRRLMKYRFFFSNPRMELFHSDWREAVISDLVSTARSLVDIEPDALNTQKLDVVYLWKNSGGYARMGSAVANILPTAFPLLGRQLFDFSSGVNWRFRTNGKLIRHMITQAHPELASFPTWYGGSAQPLGFMKNPVDSCRYAGEAFKKLVRKIGSITIKRQIFRDPGYKKPQPSHDRDFIKCLADNGYLDVDELKSAQLYMKPALEKLLRDSRCDGFRDFRELYAVTSIEHLFRSTGATCDEPL